jgi:hypothetical protein
MTHGVRNSGAFQPLHLDEIAADTRERRKKSFTSFELVRYSNLAHPEY